MNYRNAMLGATMMAVPAIAAAAPVEGLYVTLGGGVNLMPNVNEEAAYSGTLTPNPGFPINVGPYTLIGPTGQAGPGSNGTVGPTHYQTGPVFGGSIGYGLGHNLRVELGVSYSSNAVTRLNSGTGALVNGVAQGVDPLGLGYTGNEKKLTVMVNAIYDFNDLTKKYGLPLTPYIGAGVGMSHVDWSGVTRFGGGENFTATSPSLGIVNKITNAFYSSDDVLAVQGIIGAAYDVPGVPGLALTADLRMMALPSGFKQHSLLTLTFRSSPTPWTSVLRGQGSSIWGTDINYNFVAGLRYSFGATAPAAPAAAAAPAPAPAPIPAVQPARSYLVFFDWDKADLTARAKQIIADAAQNSTKIGTTRIEVAGHADTTGTAGYNQGLSMKRAEAVAAELVKDGVARSAISVTAFGSTKLLVPTGPQVREPQNRRVEIVLK